MRKLILLAFVVVATASLAFSQQFRDNANISLFTGDYVAQQNTNNRGYWYGMYADFMPIKTPAGLNFGFCGVASHVEFESNNTLNSYNGSSSTFGGGIAAGKYVEYFSQKYAGYFGGNIMIKNSQDEGIGKSIQQDGKLGTYDMKQEDIMLSIEVNLNFLKTFGVYEGLFSRSQFEAGYQKPLKTEKTSFWNKTLIQESMLWNKAAFNARFKQSICQIGRLNTLLEPKVMVGYYYYLGDDSQWITYGPEIALKKRGWDDFLSIYFFVKQQVGNYQPNLNSTQFVLGLNFNPFSIR